MFQSCIHKWGLIVSNSWIVILKVNNSLSNNVLSTCTACFFSLLHFHCKLKKHKKETADKDLIQEPYN